VTARVIPVDFKAARAIRLARAKGERIREVAEELLAVAPECLDEVCAEYELNGWAGRDDLRLAVEVVREARL
jgi:hypothetical protein